MGVSDLSVSMSILNFLANVNGIAQLWAPNGQFLGVLSSNQYDVNSISNPYGLYGGSCGLYSIQNQCGLYGGVCGLYSPYNISNFNPPTVLYQNQPVLVVTRNSYIQTNGLPVVDPDLILSVYTQLAANHQHPALINQQNMADLTSAMIQTSADRSASSAESINRAMQLGMNFIQ
jgi:hypothetical protein